jgi:transcriptional regulatory protein RtcR
MSGKATVLLSLLGPTLDQGRGPRRWDKWRPSVSLCQHHDLLIDRYELLCQRRFKSLGRQITDDIRSVSPETEVNMLDIEFQDPWDFEEVYGALHDFAHSYEFDTDEEDYLVNITTGTHVAQICLFLLTESHALPARLIQSSPPRRGRPSQFGEYRIIDLDLSKYDHIAQRFKREQQDELSFLKSGIATRNPEFNRMIEQIERVAVHSAAPMLLMGPTGSGKSLLARRVYELKKQRHQLEGQFVEINCATLRGEQAMSALFGHVKGAFTGALQDRPGLLRAAHGGMLFLDEVGELGDDEQAMLLRALEEKRFLPLGADSEAQSEFQLICGTNRDLGARVRCGSFREDLLSRINLWTFRLPGLAQRHEDIEPNLAYELKQFAGQSGTHVTFSREARQKFVKFATGGEAVWTANFRDLNGAITRMATLASGGRITVEVVAEEISRLRDSWRGTDDPGDDANLLEELLGADGVAGIDPFDRVQLAEVVRACHRSKTLSDAGRYLFSVSRARKKSPNDADRLRKYLARFGLDWKAISP